MIKQSFGTTVRFFIMAIFLNICVIFLIVSTIDLIKEEQRKQKLLQQEINQKASHRWKSYDMRIFCEKAEFQNAHIGWTCPDIDEILEER